MTKYIKIKSQIYPFVFHIFLNYKDIDKLIQDIKLKLRKDKKQLKIDLEHVARDLNNYEGFSYEYNGHIIIYCKTFKNTPACWNTLIHETLHGIFKAARYIEIKYSEDSEEFFTYNIGFITQKIKTILLKDN